MSSEKSTEPKNKSSMSNSLPKMPTCDMASHSEITSLSFQLPREEMSIEHRNPFAIAVAQLFCAIPHMYLTVILTEFACVISTMFASKVLGNFRVNDMIFSVKT